ncbi:MAG TPA: ATP-binding protein [Chitinophagaceae bacterium]|nr:ATP-binding protein [Chitinophagaceae bacterium]
MIKILLTGLVIVFAIRAGFCQDLQNKYIDSLQHELTVADNDTMRFILFGRIADVYSEINPDSAFYYAEKVIPYTKKLQLKLEEATALAVMGYAQINLGNYPRSLEYLLSAIEMTSDFSSEKRVVPSNYPSIDEFTDRSGSPRMQRLTKLSRIYQDAGILYGNLGNYERALYYYKTALPLAEESQDLKLVSITYSTLGRAYLSLKHVDSSLFCLQKAYDIAVKSGYNRYVGSILLNTGRVYLAKGQVSTAMDFFRRAIEESERHYYFRGVAAGNLYLAESFQETGHPDSALFYLRSALPVAEYLNAPDLFQRTYTALAKYYQSVKNNDSAVKYQSLIIKINDSLFNRKQMQQFQNIDFDAMQRKQQIEAAKTAYKNKVTQYGLIGGLTVFLLIAFILYRNNRQKQKANRVLEETLMNLKTTQAQLIHSEKMASLGELTAGIAHEIQNPLNFVNNFSDVNKELVDDARREMEKGNITEARSILKDIKENEEKIIHHGKRADAIVKGMMQHSHTNAGRKELRDINALADEYVRLSYHGMRAKDNSFKAKLETEFDSSISKIEIIPQEIGKVIVNVANNAFYAVTERQKQNISGYEPTVILNTSKENGKIEIKVQDNGNGMPQKILDKIFQPFFTTKPTGQGTGLGLSLAYDIVKAHGGDIKVQSKEGEGSEFIVQLPISKPTHD